MYVKIRPDYTQKTHKRYGHFEVKMDGFEYDCNMRHYIYTDIYWVMFYMNKLYTYVKMYQT